MATKKKKINNADNEAHYFGALLENMDSKIDVMLEGHQVLDKKIGDLDEKLSKKIGDLDEKVEGLNEKVEDFRKEVNYKFDVVFDELHFIRNDLKEKVGRDEFIFLEKRVFALEKSRK